MPRPQFTLRTLLVAMLVVGAFFGGMALQKQFDKPLFHRKVVWNHETWETMVLRDGTTWHREEFDDHSSDGAAITASGRSRSLGLRRATRESDGAKRPLFTRSDPQN